MHTKEPQPKERVKQGRPISYPDSPLHQYWREQDAKKRAKAKLTTKKEVSK